MTTTIKTQRQQPWRIGASRPAHQSAQAVQPVALCRQQLQALPPACLHDFKGVPQLPCLAGRLRHAINEVGAEGIESHLRREPNRKQTSGGL